MQKAWLDINVGMGLTAQGVGWLPSIGITGIPVTPVLGFELKPEEMRELQVTQHTQQAEYYNALKSRDLGLLKEVKLDTAQWLTGGAKPMTFSMGF